MNMTPKTIVVEITFIAEGESKKMIRILDDPLDEINLFCDKLDNFLNRLDGYGASKPSTSDI